MDSLTMSTPVKKGKAKSSENSNPNVSQSSPGRKSPSSSLAKSARSQKSASKCGELAHKSLVACSPRQKIRNRKFVVAKKNRISGEIDIQNGEQGSKKLGCSCKESCGNSSNTWKCLCMAYERLRTSQEEFFKNRGPNEEQTDDFEEIKRNVLHESRHLGQEIAEPGETGSPTMKRSREKFLEDAMNSAPEFGKVKFLTRAFEEMLSVQESEEQKNSCKKEKKNEQSKLMQWALPGFHNPHDADHVSSCTIGPSTLLLTSDNLGLNSRLSLSSSRDGSQSRTSIGSRRSRRTSSESCETMGFGSRRTKKNSKSTNLKPFKLLTEARGKVKEEEFSKKLQAMMANEEKARIPIAQDLPLTTDEPECLVKPPVKESTKPVDLKLNTDIRASERAEFDYQVAEKQCLIEKFKMEREKEQKMIEEEEIRRLRKELIPKAQPLPYFDRPFVPRSSTKELTIPKEPKFHVRQHKKIKCCLANSVNSCHSHQ